MPDDDSGVDQPPALGKRRRKRKPPWEQQYARLRYTPHHDVWEGETVDGEVHEVNRGAFKVKEQQRCRDEPNEWHKLPAGDAREPADSAGGADDEGFLPAADHATCHPSG